MNNKYYIFKIEQIASGEAYSEYSGTEGFSEHQLAETKYFKTCSDVAADIGKNHTYMYIELRDSFGHKLLSNTIGQRVNPAPVEQ